MIGQSVINIKSGGRRRLSTLIAGVTLLMMVVFLADWVSQIPMAALVAVMIMVSIGTFSWTSIRDLKKHPLSTNIVMLATVAVTVSTHNLAIGVFVGVLLAALFFANKVGNILYVASRMARASTAGSTRWSAKCSSLPPNASLRPSISRRVSRRSSLICPGRTSGISPPCRHWIAQ